MTQIKIIKCEDCVNCVDVGMKWRAYNTPHADSRCCCCGSVHLQVRRRGPVPPLVHLVCDDCAAERAALLLVEPQSDALVTEDVLLSKTTTKMIITERKRYIVTCEQNMMIKKL